MFSFKKSSDARSIRGRALAVLSIALLGAVWLAAQAPTGVARGSGPERPQEVSEACDDTWTPTSTENAPKVVMYHTAVWTGKEMIVWGGGALTPYYGVLEAFNTGRRYNPETNTWTSTSTTDAPSPRLNHTAVWTGKEMIVWGGSAYYPGPLTTYNTGGRYDPATDTWTPMSIAYAPSPRDEHTAVWTGTEMIVWGGRNGNDRLNTGGRYDPATDTWTPISAADASPSPRYSHTAIWTGAEMVIWGGYEPDYTGYLNTGWRYNPAADVWTPTSMTNAPTPRAEHTAIWAGTEMIVWGGLGVPGNHMLNTGGRYNLVTDTWTPTSMTNAPSPRFSHTAVWSGKEMIVKNGFVPNNHSSGWRYDPATDTWRSTSTVNAPSGWAENTAVWTGREMIVWGGSGGCYCAASANQVEQTNFFVQQHYRDFLSREPDAAGLQFWSNEINSCGADVQCREIKRINVSAAFFLSIEFQETGYLVYRTHGAAFGTRGVGGAVPLTLREFLPETQRLSRGVVVLAPGWEDQLAANKAAYFEEFVERPQFLALYPQGLSSSAFVDALNQNAGGVLSQAVRDEFVHGLDTGQLSRAKVLRAVAENGTFSAWEFNRAFVLMQYFSYLRRNPNDAPDTNFDGWQFWLDKLDQFGGNFVEAEMVKAFISSIEYRRRFGAE